MRQKNDSLIIDNFRLGARRDGALREDRLWSMRTLKNYDVIYTDGRLKIRKGYRRFNATALADYATQVEVFTDNNLNEHIMAICGKWYVVKATGSHTLLANETATAPRPLVLWGNRVFFGTNSGWYWTDNTAIGSSPTYFIAGIDKPSNAPVADITTSWGHNVGVFLNPGLIINKTDRYKIAVKLVLASAISIGSMKFSLRKPTSVSPTGNIKVSIYTDSGGNPTTTLVHADAVSTWWPVSQLLVGDYDLKMFVFQGKIDLTAGTYWAVFETDSAYKSNYLNISGPSDFYAELGVDAPAVPDHGYCKVYDNGLGSWIATNREPDFQIGGMDDSKYYDYVLTYYNSTYSIESRPSERVRMNPTDESPAVQITLPTASDAQVDKIKIYRRYCDNWNDADAAITDTYKYVGEGNEGTTFTDRLATENLGAELQTQDHYPVYYTDPDDRPTALIPKYACYWKSRIWFTTNKSSILYYTKILEEDGATGLLNDPIADYVPLENKREIEEPSYIIGIQATGQDQLIVFFKNETIYTLYGANSPLNPPDDIILRREMADNGLIGPRAFSPMMNGLVYLSKEGLMNIGGPPGASSETNQSIFDDIQEQYLDDTILAAFGKELWCLVDTDNDGYKETIMILDLERDVPTRQLVDRCWRMYAYNVKLNDITIRQTSATFRTMLAADAENKYILELGYGTTDNTASIVGELETHDIRAFDKAMLYQLDLDANYISTAGTYVITLTAHGGLTTTYTLTPSNSTDIRGHRTGLRLKSPVSVRCKVQQTAVNQDELLSIVLKYTRE